MRRWRTTVGSAIILATACALCRAAPPAQTHARFEQLQRDIPSLYLLNGLFLSTDQYDRLAGILSEAAEQKRVFEEKTADLAAQATNALERDARRVAVGEKPGRRAYELRPVTERQPKELADDLRAAQTAEKKSRTKLAGAVYDLLTDSQKAILDSFVPCFIPPQDFKNPVRVGQATAQNKPAEEMLERLRSVPDAKLDDARAKALDKMVGYVMDKRKIRYSDEAKQKVHDELSANLDKVLPKIRSMSDADFELEESALANQAVPIECDDAPAATGRDKDLRMAEEYLLNPGCLDVATARGSAHRAKSTRASAASPDDRLAASRRHMQAATLLSKLDLTSKQREQLLPILRAAATARNNLNQRIAQAEADAIEPFEALRAELAAQGPNPDTEAAARTAHRQVKKITEVECVTTLHPFEKQMDEILTKEQIALLMRNGGNKKSPPPRAVDAGAEREQDTKDVADGEARPLAFGRKYIAGEPVPVLDPSTEILFTDEAVGLLAVQPEKAVRVR